MEKEKFDLENFPTSASAKKMLSYVSDGFYDKSYVGKWIFQIMGLEYDVAQENVEDLPAQFFPETATWGLMYHEIKWGLPVRPNLSYEERRKLIYQKRDIKAPMTPYKIEAYIKSAMEIEVHVADVHDPGEYRFSPSHPNEFKVYFITQDTLDSKRAHELIDRLKQSHTAYTINDRVEIIIDNQGLEQIIFKSINLLVMMQQLNILCEISKIVLRAKIDSNCETIENMTITKKTSDYWFLNGDVLLDGSRHLDSVYIQEEID